MVRRSRQRQSLAWGWLEEFDELVRGVSGGFLFGIPLLYTMEVWWIGSFSRAPMRLGALAVTYFVVFVFNRTVGFRDNQDIKSRWRDPAMESVEAIAIGLVCTTLTLILLGQINPRTPLNEILGKAIFEGLPFSLGVALATSLMSGDRYDSENGNGDRDSHENDSWMLSQMEPSADIGATLLGAIFIAFSIAPTDEVAMLAASASPPGLGAIALSSLLISYGIVFSAGFRGQEKRFKQQGMFQKPVGETVMCYLVSLAASVVMLWFFQKVTFSDPWQIWVSYTIILGLPASIGGAAGRLAV